MENEFRIVTAAIIYDQGKFLLTQRGLKDPNLPGRWSIPAGHIEVTKNRFDVLESNLKREIFEETGLTIENLLYLDSHAWVDTEYTKITVVFIAQIAAGKPVPSQETIRLGWFTLDQAAKLNLPPNVHRVLTKAHRMLSKPQQKNSSST